MAGRMSLLDLIGGSAPVGQNELLEAASPVGTDGIPTPELEQNAVAPPAPEPNSAEALAAAPDLTPEQRAELQAQLVLAAKRQLLGGP